MRKLLATLLLLTAGAAASAQTTRLEEGWKFAFGSAADPQKDFGAGTEYFNYLTKARSIHNEGPYTNTFDDSAWEAVRVPHDWVVRLPFAPEASHSHGYKTVGWKYPETSVGWYRRHLRFSPEQEGRHFELRFDGIFRNASVWFNGFYMGTEPSGYAVQTYDITPYIDFNGDNVLCVRADASLEEGWFYEGAGIYRNAYLMESGEVHPTPGGIWTEFGGSTLNVYVELENDGADARNEEIRFRLLDAGGNSVWEKKALIYLRPQQRSVPYPIQAELTEPHLWDVCDPYLYTLETCIGTDVYHMPVGLRTAVFDAERGFLLNGRKLILKGVNLHQDHAGVGAAMPDELVEWRVKRLQELGVNAIRCSHNPASPVLLDICDRLGVLVIDENRLMGVNGHHERLLENMVRWGRMHPSVILWSVGNEEWGLENDPRGIAVVRRMQDYVHRLDPSRQTTAANAGGGTLIEGLQVHGYNYLVQNDVEGRHARHPEWRIFGSEETTGCGTRGIYYPEEGRMPAINRTGEYENVIERGWQFYKGHPWTGGVFWWTGLDYRGEPNPLAYPAVGSEFGLLDYCGFWKDEAWYLQAWWTETPVLHILPHWNLSGHEGEAVAVWVYSNCDQVRLSVNGRSLGRKAMPQDGHLSWQAVYKPGKVVAEGYRNGRRVLRQVVETTGPAAGLQAAVEWADATPRPQEPAVNTIPAPDGRLAIVTVQVLDKKGRFVPDGCPLIDLYLEGEGEIVGAGNGDPSYRGDEQPADGRTLQIPAFNGLLQVLVRRDDGSATLHVRSQGLTAASIDL